MTLNHSMQRTALASPLVPSGRFRLAGLNPLLSAVEEAEHFCRWLQEKVAKIIHCGLPRYDEGSLELTPAAFLFGKPC